VNADDLKREFAQRAVPCSGGLLLLWADDAIALVRRAASVGAPVLGVDGMFVSARGTESPIEHIADYAAAVAQGDGCWSGAESFIEERRHLGMAFEVVLGDSNVHAS
jgi:hypothetical protein